MRRRLAAVISAGLLLAIIAPATVAGGAYGARTPEFPSTINADVRTTLASVAPAELVAVVVTLDRQTDVRSIGHPNATVRRTRLLTALRDTARDAQRGLLRRLQQLAAESRAAEIHPLWIIDAIGVRATPDVIAEIAARPEVRSVSFNEVEAIVPAQTAATETSAEANLGVVGASTLWALGARGAGVVVATLDTGVDGTHPDLAARWRGGANSWFDPNDEHPDEPIDVSGHGTSVMGVLTGGADGGTAVGMAPEARWIAAKIFDDRGAARTLAIHEAFQWILDPDGDPVSDDAPDVVNASWSFDAPSCNREFEPDVLALRATGILPVFAAGNFGPTAGTAVSPGSYVDAFAVGATDDADVLWPQSGRGPDACSASPTTYPDLVAPGVGIHTTDTSWLYVDATGTSVAAPHVSGALALLAGVFGSLTPAEQEAALIAGARDLGAAGPDDAFGRGRLDAYRAYQALLAGSITGSAFDDLDGDAARDNGERSLAGIRFILTSAGADGTLGTADDAELARRITDSRGEYAFEGLAAGSYRVTVDPASAPPGRIRTDGNAPTDVALSTGDDRRGVNAAYTPPATIAGTIFNDADRDAVRDSGEIGIAQVTVRLRRPGADGVYGTSDDTAPVSSVTGASGAYNFPLLLPGPYRIEVVASTVPAGMVLTTANLPINGSLATGATVQAPPIGYAVPTVRYLSLLDNGSVGALAYADEDVLAYNGASFSMLFDGSDVGLGAADVDAIDRLTDGTYLMSMDGNVTLPGVGAIADEDLVRFAPTRLGQTTQGTWSMYFDGSDVGLAGPGVDVDAFDLVGPWLLISVDIDVTLPGAGGVSDEDLVRFTPTRTGWTTQGSWNMYFDGSDVGLTLTDEDVDGFVRDANGSLHLSTVGNHSVGSTPAVNGGDDDLVVCTPTSLGTTTACTWRPTHSFRGVPSGLAAAADVDAVAQQ